mmetsp:Transcript_11442/g.53206  ORF Transcript_11442/g.53206 Transcript_11442/m.53206 type:complete len:273 (+) Transcript_11442:2900-3718(+)
MVQRPALGAAENHELLRRVSRIQLALHLLKVRHELLEGDFVIPGAHVRLCELVRDHLLDSFIGNSREKTELCQNCEEFIRVQDPVAVRVRLGERGARLVVVEPGGDLLRVVASLRVSVDGGSLLHRPAVIRLQTNCDEKNRGDGTSHRPKLRLGLLDVPLALTFHQWELFRAIRPADRSDVRVERRSHENVERKVGVARPSRDAVAMLREVLDARALLVPEGPEPRVVGHVGVAAAVWIRPGAGFHPTAAGRDDLERVGRRDVGVFHDRQLR